MSAENLTYGHLVNAQLWCDDFCLYELAKLGGGEKGLQYVILNRKQPNVMLDKKSRLMSLIYILTLKRSSFYPSRIGYLGTYLDIHKHRRWSPRNTTKDCTKFKHYQAIIDMFPEADRIFKPLAPKIHLFLDEDFEIVIPKFSRKQYLKLKHEAL